MIEDIKNQISEIDHKKLENIVNEHFDEYESVFKALNMGVFGEKFNEYAEFDKLIKKNFKRFDLTFKALA